MLGRGFEVVEDYARVFPEEYISLPLMGTAEAAGADIYSNETVEVMPFEFHEFWTDIKVKCPVGEHAELFVRSSIGRKGWRNALSTGIIDRDYYGNPSNDGNVMLKLQNMTNQPMTINKGDRIGQILFKSHHSPTYGYTVKKGDRIGGHGSTGK